jgi:hypothetical protein
MPGYTSVCSCSFVFARTYLVVPASFRLRLCLLEHTWLYQCLFVFVCVCNNMPGYTSTCSCSPVFVGVCSCSLERCPNYQCLFSFAVIFHDCDKLLHSSQAYSHIFNLVFLQPSAAHPTEEGAHDVLL